MNYENFKQYVADHIKEFLPQDYNVHEISITEQRKNNNVIWDALSIKGDRNIIPAIYLEPYYQAYTEGVKMDAILQKIADIYMKSMEQVGKFSADEFQYEKVKNGIFVVVQNAEMNRELLEKVPHEIRDDLALLYRVNVELSNGEKGSVLIHNTHLESWGIDEKTLKEVAWNNMHDFYPPEFSTMSNVLSSAGYDEILEGVEFVEMYVLSNKEKQYGAAYMFDTEVMSRIAEEIGGDIVVIPSSIHESILLKKQGDTDFDILREMVKEVNCTQLHPTEILSDEVYQYSRDAHVLSRVVAMSQEEMPMPDRVSIEEMYSYGYQWDGMLPLTKERALELLDTEMVLHKLYDNGTEAVLDSREEILIHEGLFGVEKDAWVNYLESQSQSAVPGMTQEM
ncbi:DUF5688 family protein [Bacteroides heparinolyticus]|uniref:DUF5688 family protein n=1 Tax=Prevotella heparinolytica TaxID=28113 RepID=UPI0035A02CD4